MYRIINLTPFAPRKNYYLNKMNDVTILIKTLERKQQLIDQLFSIQKLKFHGHIIIADDSKVPYGDEIQKLFPKLNITYLPMPYDSGTAAGRNLMLEHTKTSFFLLCDDDFIFEPRTRVPVMRKLLIDNNLDILAGVFIEYRPVTKWEYRRKKIFNKLLKYRILLPPTNIYEYFGGFTIEGEICKMSKIEYHDPFTICDLAHNFFIAKTDKVKKFGGWNPILKGGEHQNFFIRAKLNNLKVATTRRCGVIHNRWTPNSEEYVQLRERGKNYQKVALQEFGITKLENYENVTGGKFAE